MTVSGPRREEILKEVVEARVDRFEEMLKQMAADGPPLPGKKQEPAARLAAYMRGTLPEEIDMVLDADYELKASLGIYPPLQSPFWALLIQLPKFQSGWSPFSHHQKEFRNLLLTLDKRMTNGATQPVGEATRSRPLANQAGQSGPPAATPPARTGY